MSKRSASPTSSSRPSKTRRSAEVEEAASSSSVLTEPDPIPQPHGWFRGISTWFGSRTDNEPTLPTSNLPRLSIPSSSLSSPSHSTPSPFDPQRPQASNGNALHSTSFFDSTSPSPSQSHSNFNFPDPHNIISTPGRPKLQGRALVMGKPGTRSFPFNGVTKRPRKRHIHEAIYQASVRDNIQHKLFQLENHPGDSGDSNGFKEYRERIKKLELDDILSSSSAFPSFATAHSLKRDITRPSKPPSHSSEQQQLQLKRAIQKAIDALSSPRPPLPLPNLDKLRLDDFTQDTAIDARIRPKKRKLPTALSPAADSAVTRLLQKRSGLISAVGREQIQAEDIQRLRPGQWLNDEIINFYGAMLTERSLRWLKNDHSDAYFGAQEIGASNSPETPKTNGVKGKARERGDPLDIHYFNTFFYAKLTNPGYEKARLNKWTKKVDIFAKDVILIPINLGNSHWTFSCINFRLKRIEYYDSLGNNRVFVYERLRDYLQKESLDKRKMDFDLSEWEDYFSEMTPQQENAYDCGMFTCQFMEAASRGEEVDEFAFGQKDMTYLRRRLVWEIGEGRVGGWK